MRSRIPRALLLAVMTLPLASGCYTSAMTTTSMLQPGMETVLAVTDQGRVSLAPRIGPGVMRVTGTLAERTDTTLTLQVSTVEYFGGIVSPWEGQQLTLETSLVGVAHERRFSRARTWTAIGTGIGAFVALLVSLDLVNVGGAGGIEDPPVNP